jgi:hypothetical protein
MARAIRKPPRNRKIIWSAYGAADCGTVRTPRSGNKISGRSAVAARGIASVTQRVTMRTATAAVKRAAGGRISFRKGMARMAMKRNAPASMPKSERIKLFYLGIVRNVAICFSSGVFF